ncbi:MULTISPECIES: nucleotidyltransferase [unclassified Clostridium]|uniref:nucleotidyltransferase n=1 Tax=unclassified Clostridium TaxID=2614128 RepID=UPI00290F7C30|nr:nucleotidyltransferase [Clostridium sp.]MDU5105894.1 nucleotidyltransferase [Clostridium sp.]
MNITGIITEYNPFHNGHLYHLSTAKKVTNCDAIVCIMSGNFVQRGEPAIIDKWKRAEMALLNGVDLIIELPTFYAVSSAEFFAKGAINILDRLGVVNNIFFGSECGDIDLLYKIARILTNEPKDLKLKIKENLKSGITYAKAREKALIDILNEDSLNEVLSNSNNILGIEYIKAIIKCNSNINPLTMKREGSKYNDKKLSTIFSSATSIRENIKNGFNLNSLEPYMPSPSLEILKSLANNNYPFIFEENMYRYIKYRLLTNCINFNNLFEVKEGIDNKFIKEIYNSSSYEDLILKAKSKRYTYTKISRLLCQLFFSLDNYNFNELLQDDNLYARVLGFNDKGRQILKEMKKKSTIPIITKVPKNIDNKLLQLDIQCTKAYSILNHKVNPLSDYLLSPIIK